HNGSPLETSMKKAGFSPVEMNFLLYNMPPEDPMIFLMDCKHNIKKLRNNLEKSSASGSARCLKNGDDHIFWRFWKDAYLWHQSQHSCPIHEKLKEDHFQLTPSSRMRNNLAEDVLDKKMLFLMKAYKNHLECSENQEHASRLNGSIMFVQHTSFMVEFFSSKQAIYDSNDTRLQSLLSTLSYFSKWKASVLKSDEFVSFKLWFDLQAMILGMISLVKIKLSQFPGSIIKPAVINQDVVENHFCQLRVANGQNENPTYLLTQATQNSIVFGQRTVSKKCNTGTAENSSFTELPKEKLFSAKNKCKNQKSKIRLTL
ncbi:Hypothetical predicted protein, partial [Paramuricea clavata]